MKFNCGLTQLEKMYSQMEWHDYFAWFPIRVGKNDCRWLETVEHRYTRVTECKNIGGITFEEEFRAKQ